MKLLRLKNDGKNFETIYYNAIDMMDPHVASKLMHKYPGTEKAPNYWREQAETREISDNLLISTIVMNLGMPFSAYVLEEKTDDRIVISPWLFSSKMDRHKLIYEVFGEGTTTETLSTYSRTLSFTAEFLLWLNEFEKKNPEQVWRDDETQK
ncbi:MAG: hypothetical protein PHI27_12910 [Eubacteriales bacterium]|nr:hypothetical protein [Eubacteriales bacterium]MDD3883122.1 hypothetical protein [Eubacteriales bacterium]MDD4513308.1 hypothetical protein [Eubacteriales bacterium]